MTTSTLSISLALLGGVLNVLSPCVLPILPVLLGRSLQSHTYGPVALLGGLITGFALAGSLLGITTSWFTGLLNLLRNGAIALLLFLGLLAIFPTWRYLIFSYIQVGKWAVNHQVTGAFWLLVAKSAQHQVRLSYQKPFTGLISSVSS